MPKRTRSETAKAKREEEEPEIPQEEEHPKPKQKSKRQKKEPEPAAGAETQDENLTQEDEQPKPKQKGNRRKKEPAPAKEAETQDENLTTFQVPFKKDKHIPCEARECSDSTASPSLIFTHGAGGGLESAAMRSFATGFARCGNITSFQGNMNLTSRVGMFRTVVAHVQEGEKKGALVLGGRSMGARAAVLTALELISEGTEVKALVLVSYPLTASKNGKQEREYERREKILLDLPEGTDVLFVGGTKDVQCNLEALGEVRREMKAGSWIVEVRGADHGMGLTPKAGTREVGELMGEVAARWLAERDEKKRTCEVFWDGEEEKACQGEWMMEGGEVGAEKQSGGEKRETG